MSRVVRDLGDGGEAYRQKFTWSAGLSSLLFLCKGLFLLGLFFSLGNIELSVEGS